jgi:hypothetical protein
VLVFDTKGNFLNQGKLNGRPTCVRKLASLVVVASEKGEVRAFAIEPVKTNNR